MLRGLSKSGVNRYKTSFAAFPIIALTTLYVVWPPLMLYVNKFRAAIVKFNDTHDGSDNISFSGNNTSSFDPITAAPENGTVNKTGRYVSLGKRNFDNRRLGNQLFNFAAMLHVARLTGRRVAMVRRHPHGWLDRWFQVFIIIYLFNIHIIILGCTNSTTLNE